jgi:signal transduction histidine kinase
VNLSTDKAERPPAGNPTRTSRLAIPAGRALFASGILFVAFVSLLLIGLDLEQSWTAHDARMQQARTETENLARSLAQHAQDVFETSDAILKGLRDTLAHEGTSPEAIRLLEHRMRTQVANQTYIHSLFVFDELGRWVASSLPAPEFEAVRDVNYANRNFFSYHRGHNDDAILIGVPILAQRDGSWVINMSRRLNHADGSFAGVVDASISIDLFQQFLKTFDIGQRGAIALINGQGIILVRRPFDDENRGRNVAETNFFLATRGPGDTGSVEYASSVDGTPRLGGFHHVKGFDLVMFVALDKREVLAAWWEETKIHLAWSAVILLVVVTLGYRLILQIRDRVAAETVSHKLRLEADQSSSLEAERKTYERELEQQKRELERSNSALEQFAYAASHDLQSPLRAIALLAQWIAEDIGTTASLDTTENLKLLTGRVARLQMLISGLLAYARLGRTDLAVEDVDLAAAVQDVVTMLDPRPNFVVACDGAMPAIRTHRTPLELVLKNLISNALQHHDRAEGRLDVAMRVVDGMAEIRISDDGPGIEKRYHDEIFVIFKTLQSRDETELGGIGLAMVKKQVTENGGDIWVESAPPVRGSTFIFTWKLAPP